MSLPSSRVYFADTRVPFPPEYGYLEQLRDHGLVAKVRKLFYETGLNELCTRRDWVAVKVHMGTAGSDRYLRPIFVKTVVEEIKRCGGRPYVTETLTSGTPFKTDYDPRREFLEHWKAIAANGFTAETVGAPLVIADAPKGTSDVLIAVQEPISMPVYIADGVVHADSLISLAHFKGHPASFGGAIKNVGVGCLSKRGKHWIHTSSKPWTEASICKGCGTCIEVCLGGALRLVDGKVMRNQSLCVTCGGCGEVCPNQAVLVQRHSWDDLLNRTAVSASVIMQHIGKDRFGFINFLIDITPWCDCYPFSHLPVVRDLGVLASRDPVAVDKACLDMVREAEGVPGSVAEHTHPGQEKFAVANPGDAEASLAFAEKIGLGSRNYDLVRIVPDASI